MVAEVLVSVEVVAVVEVAVDVEAAMIAYGGH